MTPHDLVQASRPFRHAYRVRFDEAGVDGLVRASTLLRYVQDVAWVHSERLGFDRAWYAERGVAWLVRAAEVAVLGRIPMGASLELTTDVVGHRKVWARRRSEAFLDGAVVGWIHTDWVLVDRRGALARIPPEIGAAFPNPIADFPIGRVELADVGPEAAVARRFRVRPHELDPNGHVNNAAYVDWLEESIADESVSRQVPRRYRLEYAAAAGPGDELVATAWPDGRSWSHRLRLATGGELVRARLEV
ncbi:MAG TPA: acyl-ACP thioesterase domain-containing protein [Candidatus Limnocylindrales bacterium]|nr:acyl-ACP thioesterase domain-containing protein [Candidatus Limnocylindrales bacterium]